MRAVILLVGGSLFLLAACGTETEPVTTTSTQPVTTSSTQPATTTAAPTTTATPTTTAASTTTTTEAPTTGGQPFAIYAMAHTASGEAGPFLIAVTRLAEGEEVITPEQAVAALLDGLDEIESAMGLSTAVPEGTRLLGFTIDGPNAVVDLSSEFETGGPGGTFSVRARLAQLVYTATRFLDIDAVELLIEGEPVAVFSAEGLEIDAPLIREDFVDLRPAILVEEPAWGGEVDVPFIAAGLASVFEATVEYEVVDLDGKVLTEGFTTATDGLPAWGVFVAELDPDIAGVVADTSRQFDGELVVFETSPESGQRQWVMRYPVTFVPLR